MLNAHPTPAPIRCQTGGQSSLAKAATAWRQAIGPGFVTADELERYARGCSTIGLTRIPPVILHPQSSQDVIRIVKIANDFKVPIYPISRGRNWGYGAACTTEERTVLVDCGAMDTIDAYDHDLGVVRVGPGVTQQQLSEFLIAKGDRWMTPTTGAGPNASILGNAIERGYGITPVADHFAAIQNMEVVLPDGSLLRSPLAELGAEKIDKLFKWGIGPSIEGLFSQSSLGVVTSITIALARRPAVVSAFLSKLKDDQLEKAVETVRDLQQQYPGLVGGINLMNRRRVLSMACRPDQQSSDAIPQDEVDRLAKQHGIAEWSMLGAIYTEKSLYRPLKKTIRNRLRASNMRGLFVDHRRVKALKRILGSAPGQAAKRLHRQATQLERGLRILEGYPDEIALQLCYWRNQSVEMPEQDLDPVRDRCGLIWYSPLVPIDPKDVRRFVQTTEQVCLEHGIDPLITLTTVNPRCFDCTIPLLFDAENEDARHRVKACYKELFHQNEKQGYVPYRMGADSMKLIANTSSDFWRVCEQVKEAIDPSKIISPGRYAAA